MNTGNQEDEAYKHILDTSLKRIGREINLLKQCPFDGLVKLGSVEPSLLELESGPYFAYSEEFIDGASVDNLISSRVNASEPEITQLLKTLILGVKHLTDLSAVHRDIKPANVIQSSRAALGFILVDLGLAFSLTDDRLTSNPGTRFGTFDYFPPEWLTDNSEYLRSINFRSDFHCIAVTVYEFACHEHPLCHGVKTPAEKIDRIKNYTPTPLSKKRTDLPAELCSLVDSMMRKKSYLRPNIEQALKTLEELS